MYYKILNNNKTYYTRSKKSQTQIINQQTNLMFEKTSQVMKLKLLFILLLISFYTGVFAQSTKTAQNGTNVVRELNSFLTFETTSGKARMASSDAVTSNPQRLKNLVTQVQSATYFYDGVVKNYGDNPKSLFTDIKGFNLLNSEELAKMEIELVTIRVENKQDFQNKIDLSNVSNFPKLKFIYILTTFDYDINNVSKVINNNNDSYVIVFKSEKGA